MAEFKYVMRQRARMCKSLEADCYYCELEGVGCDGSVLENLDRIERTIMDWAAKHPETRYPTWQEWAEANFPDAYVMLLPCAFTACPIIDKKCSKSECIKIQIPADIAQKLGIKPITEKE